MSEFKDLELAPARGTRMLVVGGCGGIGRVLVRAALERGIDCTVMDMPIAIEQHAPPKDVTVIPIDATDESKVQSAFATLGKRWDSLGTLVNLAGFTNDQVPVDQVPPAEFARTYNAAQIAIAPVLSLAANAPIFLGRRLWDETRIALFRQAVDERVAAGGPEDWRPARVTFGHGWVRSSAYELFCESVALHPPIMPVLGANRYLFSTVGSAPTLEIRTVRRTSLVLCASLAVLSSMLALIYWPVSRHPGFLMVAATVLIALSIMNPEASLLVAQAASLGGMLGIVGYILARMTFRRRRAPISRGSSISSDRSPGSQPSQRLARGMAPTTAATPLLQGSSRRQELP